MKNKTQVHINLRPDYTIPFEQEFIDNHFRMNRFWKQLFLKEYPNYTPETYINNGWELLNKLGINYTIQRMNDNPESKHYDVVEADLYKGPVELDDFVVGTGLTHITNATIKLLIWVVVDREVDLSEFTK